MKYRSIFLLFTALLLIPSLPLSAANRGLQPVLITTSEGEEVGLYRESHALLIGVSDYQAGWPDLPGVKKDVEIVRSTLEEQGFNVVMVNDPSRTELEQAFTDFINTYGQETENRLLFYFSGHGHTLELAYGDEMGYIVPSDAPNPYEDESGFIATALDMQMIEVYAKRIQAKHAIFLFDSCFSGSIFSLSRAAPESISYKTAQPVRQFLTSGSAEEQVPDESIFRQQFVSALSGEGDLNSDGYVTGAELGEFLQEKVVNYSKGAQHPQYGKIRHATLDKGDFVFPLQSRAKTAAIASSSTQNDVIEPAGADPETEMWKLVKNSDASSDVQDFLNAFPDGQYAKVAALKLKQLERQDAETAEEPETEIDTDRAIVQQSHELTPAPAEPTSDRQQEQQGSPPGQDTPPPQKDHPLLKVIANVLTLRDDLLQAAEKRDANYFEEVADFLEERTDEDFERAIEDLERKGNTRSARALKLLQKKLPERLDAMVDLAKKGKWNDLADMLQKKDLSDIAQQIKEHLSKEEQLPGPPRPLRR